MKQTLQLLTVGIVILIMSASVSAQTQSVGDTLIIGPISEITDLPMGALNEAIEGDTTAAGERIHSVYKLHRGTQYILTEIIDADFPLVIVADPPDDENHPPIIRGGVREDGSTVNLWWRLFDHATFENLWLTGINLDGTGPISWIAQEKHGSGHTITFKGTIVEFPFTWWAVFADWGGQNNYIIEDCLFMNIGTPGAEWNGAVFHHMRIDSLIVRHTTFYNFGTYAINTSEQEGVFYTEVEHCTFVNSMQTAIHGAGGVIQKYSNNLIVNPQAISNTVHPLSREFNPAPWGTGIMDVGMAFRDPVMIDSLYGPGGVYGEWDPKGTGELTPEELVLELRNNAWWYTDPVVEYWGDFDVWPSYVVPQPWMNAHHLAMFEHDAPWTWESWEVEVEDTLGDYTLLDTTLTVYEWEPFEFLVEENTMNVDPGIVDMNGTDALLAEAVVDIRRVAAGQDPVHDPALNWHGVDDYLDFANRWPLDFDLSYTNPELLTASTHGFPVGDLNWFPDKYEQWLIVSVDEPGSDLIPEDFYLSHAYPNPFNPETNIDFRIPHTSDVRITIYNVLGQQVSVIMDQELHAGSYTVTWNGTNDRGFQVPSGVYLYRIEAGQFNETKKVVFLK